MIRCYRRVADDREVDDNLGRETRLSSLGRAMTRADRSRSEHAKGDAHRISVVANKRAAAGGLLRRSHRARA